MLGVSKHTQKYLDECRSRVAEQVSAYQALVAAARNQAAHGESELTTAIGAFEPHFFNVMVLALDSYFVHRLRGMEMKDGNPLNEVRLSCNSMMNNNWMGADKTIKYDPTKSVLKYRVGDEIILKADDFILLSSAFFAEIESKYL